MKAQKLKTLNDFLKRAEIIPQALLIITKDDSINCEQVIRELRALNYDIPFYELSITENPNLKDALDIEFSIENLPTFVYFRGRKMISQTNGLDNSINFSQFLTTAVHQLDF